MNKKIPVFDIKIGELEKKYIKDCLDNSSIGQGSYVKEFEEKFSNFVNCKFGITTTSGTTALHLALKTLRSQMAMKYLFHPAQIWLVHSLFHIVMLSQFQLIFTKKLGK